jgi:hypothetical protein
VIGIGAVAFGILVLLASYALKDLGFVGHVADGYLMGAGLSIIGFGLVAIVATVRRAKDKAVELRSRISDFRPDRLMPKPNLFGLRLATFAGVLAITTVLAMFGTGDTPFDGVENDEKFGSPAWAQDGTAPAFLTYDALIIYGGLWWVASMFLMGLAIPPIDEHDAGDLRVGLAIMWGVFGFPLIFVMVYKT